MSSKSSGIALAFIHHMETSAQNIYQFLKNVAKKFGSKPALFGRNLDDAKGDWYSLSSQDILEKSEKLARKLIRLGMQKGDRALILAKSRPEFSIGFFAIPLAGGVTVPLDIRLTLHDQKHIVDFSGAKFILCTNDETLHLAQRILAFMPSHGLQLIRIDLEEDPSSWSVDFNHTCPSANEMMLLAFTSGTTSLPKGVMLSWENIHFQIEATAKIYSEKSQFRMLSILPLHHMFELTAGFLMPFSQGGEIYYANSLIPHQIISFFKDFKIRDLLVVPLFLRTLKKGIEGEMESSRLKRAWFRTTYSIASKIPSSRIRRLLFFPLHRKFGGEIRQMISGAAALDQKVDRFFNTLGISIYEGYGMTEASPVISCSSRGSKKPGSIGKGLPGLEIVLEPTTNEILVRGPSIMKGYYKDQKATEACLTLDGWLNTGDVGELDEEGFITIRGRSKEIIVLGNGKKVVPEEVEERLREIPDVQEICVLGMQSTQGPTRGTEVVTAVVVPHPRASQQEVQKNLHQACLELSYYKRPTKFVFMTEPLPVTSTLKIKKNLVKNLLLQQRITV